jgi:signal transduction histidine kinase
MFPRVPVSVPVNDNMSESAPSSSLATRPPRVHPTVRLGFLTRISIYPFSFVLFGVHMWARAVPAWIWVLFVLHQWIWPHVARRIARRSADSQAAELRNLLVDAVVIGCFAPVAQYSLWPNAAAFLGILSGNISVGGPRFAARGVVVYLLGAGVMTLYTGFHPDLFGASRFTQMAGPIFVGAYLCVFAWLTYDRQRSMVRINRTMRQQHAEIKEQDYLLKLHAAELEEALVAAQSASAAKSNFLANMSHELRTPLNSIIGFGNILLRNSAGTLREQELLYLSRLRNNGLRLLGLINGVLDLTKVDALQSTLKTQPVDVGALLRETLAELEPQAELRNVELVAELADTGLLATDICRLRQIMLNLLSNAVKFTSAGTVTVRLLADPETMLPSRIEVSDTGIGIAADRLDAVFEPFQQEDDTTARLYGGTGLGLTITRALARVMGWEIDVRSTVGVGSTFSILIPTATPMAEIAA